MKGSAWHKEGLGATIDVEEEEELAEAGDGEGTATEGAGPAEGGHPDKVRSKAEVVERLPWGKECSGETAEAVGDATDAGTQGCPPGGGGTPSPVAANEAA